MSQALLIKGNCDGLQFSDNDISLAEEAFKTLGITCTYIDGNQLDVLNSIATLIDNSYRDELLLIYYTGHAVFRNSNISLKLALGHGMLNFFSIGSLIDTLSNANTKRIILILDCCNAGNATAYWPELASDKSAMLLASGKLEAAKESMEFKASCFTYYIHKAICNDISKIVKNDKVYLSLLFDEVLKNIDIHNAESDDFIPRPELLSLRSKDICLGENKTCSQINELNKLISEYKHNFIHCMEECDRACFGDQKWCSILSRVDANIFKFVIPSVREFIKEKDPAIYKLNVFFKRWFENEESYLCILGDMGVGKSSACIYLFYYLCKSAVENSTMQYVPIFIPLNEISIDYFSDSNLYLTIQKYTNNFFSINNIRVLLSQRKFVFILDGFDEISGSQSTVSVLKNYDALKTIFRLECKTILSCRTHYFAEEGQLEEVLTGRIPGTDLSSNILGNSDFIFNMIEIVEFSEDEIFELLKLLLPNEDTQKIWKRIGEIYDLKDLAKRAILLKMIIQTWPEINQHKNIINSSELYYIYTHKLLRREVEERKVGLDISEKEHFIGYISYLMYKNQLLSINSNTFDKEIKSYFEGSIYSRDQLNNVNYDCKVATFFSRDRNDNYFFIHKSFFEYYFARWCIEEIKLNKFESWNIEWFSNEIAKFISSILSTTTNQHLIYVIFRKALSTNKPILIWNTIHILSLLEPNCIQGLLDEKSMKHFIELGNSETNVVIIRQYCRVIAKFIDRKEAEKLIDKIINIVRGDDLQNSENDRTYTNYYGGTNAACSAFIRHLSAPSAPKYDAKLHLYLLEHMASSAYADQILAATSKWSNIDEYKDNIEQAVCEIRRRSEYVDSTVGNSSSKG